MEVDRYVEQVQQQLTAAAALGDETSRGVAQALVAAAEPAMRLAVLRAVAAAADDITVALLDAPATPSVGVRLDGDDLRVEVRLAEPGAQPVEVPDDDTTARVSLRLPEALKEQVDVAARSEGVSVNTWLVRAASLALAGGRPRSSRPAPGHAQRLTGWVNG